MIRRCRAPRNVARLVPDARFELEPLGQPGAVELLQENRPHFRGSHRIGQRLRGPRGSAPFRGIRPSQYVVSSATRKIRPAPPVSPEISFEYFARRHLRVGGSDSTQIHLKRSPVVIRSRSPYQKSSIPFTRSSPTVAIMMSVAVLSLVMIIWVMRSRNVGLSPGRRSSAPRRCSSGRITCRAFRSSYPPAHHGRPDHHRELDDLAVFIDVGPGRRRDPSSGPGVDRRDPRASRGGPDAPLKVQRRRSCPPTAPQPPRARIKGKEHSKVVWPASHCLFRFTVHPLLKCSVPCAPCSAHYHRVGSLLARTSSPPCGKARGRARSPFRSPPPARKSSQSAPSRTIRKSPETRYHRERRRLYRGLDRPTGPTCAS